MRCGRPEGSREGVTSRTVSIHVYSIRTTYGLVGDRVNVKLTSSRPPSPFSCGTDSDFRVPLAAHPVRFRNKITFGFQGRSDARVAEASVAGNRRRSVPGGRCMTLFLALRSRSGVGRTGFGPLFGETNDPRGEFRADLRVIPGFRPAIRLEKAHASLGRPFSNPQIARRPGRCWRRW